VSHRAWYLGIAGAILLAVALFALRFPVLLDAYDQYGWQIECGSGYHTDLAQADTAGGDYPAECGTALMLRRLWTISLALIGLAAVLAVLVAAIRTPEHRSLAPRSDSA
jgi:hypothetical protein